MALGEPVIRLHMEAYLGAPESYDSVEIDGSPRISQKIAGGIHGDVATASIVINSIPAVLNATPANLGQGVTTVRPSVCTAQPLVSLRPVTVPSMRSPLRKRTTS